MKHLLSTYDGSRDNNFNLIRFIAAALVLFTHSYMLVTGSAGNDPLGLIIGKSWGSAAVDVFFVTSGFLIAGSYNARNNLIIFPWQEFFEFIPH